MAKLVSWCVIVLTIGGIGFLIALPMLAEAAANRLETTRPSELPEVGKLPPERDEPMIQIERLNEQLRLPRIDESLEDEHSQAAIAAYSVGDYRKAFDESVLALDPTPLERNQLYEALLTSEYRLGDGVQKPNGRVPIKAVDDALKPVIESSEPETVGKLNNASAMLILYVNSPGTRADEFMGYFNAGELAFQAADLDPGNCPALLNLTLLQSVPNTVVHNLQPPGTIIGESWTNYYDRFGCAEPALLYYLTQQRLSPGEQSSPQRMDRTLAEGMSSADRLAEEYPSWAGLAHAAKGDGYYWHGVYSSERAVSKRAFTSRNHLQSAVREYQIALRLQPDDLAIHHGLALSYLELGKLSSSLKHAKKAHEAYPDSALIADTLTVVYSRSGMYEEAAAIGRDLGDVDRYRQTPVVVPFSPVSHDPEFGFEMRLTGQGAAAIFDDRGVITPFTNNTFGIDNGSSIFDSSANGKLVESRDQMRQYNILLNDLLAGDPDSFEDDIESVPDDTSKPGQTLLLDALASLMSQESDTTLPSPRTQLKIDEFISATSGQVDPSANEPETTANAPFYRAAGNLYRQHGQYENALRIYDVWQKDISEVEPEHLQFVTANYKGEALYLDRRYEDALVAFQRSQSLYEDYAVSNESGNRSSDSWPQYTLRQAFMHEKLQNYSQATDLYRKVLGQMRDETNGAISSASDRFAASRRLGDMLLRKARANEAAREEAGGTGASIEYLEAADSYRRALATPGLVPETQTEVAANNLGIALIKAGRFREAERVLGVLLGKPAPESWTVPPTPDMRNPIFHLNLGWNYQLDGRPEMAREQYLKAVENDPTFYPALNDLGVLSAKSGRHEEARGYFGSALDVREDYDLALYNMGVSLQESGPGGFLASEYFLGRAVSENHSFAGASYDYAFDNELYFLNLDLGGAIPPDWEFAREAERSTFVVSLAAMSLLLFGILRKTAVNKGQEMITGRLMSFGEQSVPGKKILDYLRRLGKRWMAFMQAGQARTIVWWMTPVAIAVTTPIVTLVLGWDLVWSDSSAPRPVVIATLLFVTLVSLMAHHCGHAVAALRWGVQVGEAPWPAGILQAIAIVAIGGPAIASMPATGVTGESGDKERQFVYFAGPLASIVLVIFFFVMFLVTHIPLYDFGIVLNLAMASASLLALPPLEGAEFSRGYYARWGFRAATLVTIMAAFFAIRGFL